MLDDFQDDDPVKNSEFLDEFRQRLNSQPIENLEERKKDISKSQHIFLGTILGVGLAGIASWFILSPDYDSTENVEIPVVRRTNTAVKVQPVNPGGMEILNQDKTIYDIVEKNNTDNAKIENILPPAEEPKLPTVVANDIQEKTDAAVSKTNDVIKSAEKIIAKEEQKNFMADQPEEVKKEIKLEIVNSDKTEVAVAETNSQPQPVVKDTPKEELKAETLAPKKEVNKVAVSGMWQIQLISSPNQTAMEKAWKDLTKKYNQLNGLSHEIESADLGTKGTFYRLKAGAFQTRGEAERLCNSIKSSGGSCLVKKKQ
ncbi:MAG: SPOR domain-containing protein [Alphaproteobacteria bacterium]|nr:SPOR domain-containing protein [Alphaproteobacteria bacterium]